MARCASCQTINRGPNTPGRRCQRCNGPMVLDPRADGFSDLRLTNAMDRLSAGGHLAYTETQLYYATAGRKTVKPGLLSRLRKGRVPPTHVEPSLPFERFATNLRRWLDAGGGVAGRLLDERALRADPLRHPTDGPSPTAELTAHGFDRALVVDDGEVAAMLVNNNVHVDHRCAVLSEDGYPEAFRAELVDLLNRNPRLVVGVLHGASAQGLGMIHRIRRWFPDPAIRLVEIGLRPAQVRRSNLYAHRDDRAAPADDPLADPSLARLADWEREWLAWGLRTPLGSLEPSRLARVIGSVFANAARIDERRLAESPSVGGSRRHYDDTGVGPEHGIWWWDRGDDDRADGGDGSAAFGVGLGSDGFDGADFDGDG